MSLVIIPETFGVLLAAFSECFQAQSYRTFQWLVSGWVHCLGRRTITGVALAAGAVGERHISVFHRFFARARWSLEAVGRIVFELAVRWVPADQPLYLLGDDTLTRKSGKCVSLAGMHHDPLLSSGRKPFFSFGHVWVVLGLWVPLPMGRDRGFALPLLVRLYTSAKRGGRADAPSRQTTGKRQRVAEAAHAARDRRTKLELLVAARDGRDRGRVGRGAADLPGGGQRLHWARDAGEPAAQRRGSQPAAPRRGARLPNPQQIAARCRCWPTVSLRIYGRTVTARVRTARALWWSALREGPVRLVLVRDPSGQRRAEAVFCTDLSADAVFILEAYARRWSLEVTFHDAKQSLGLADPQAQAPQAQAPQAQAPQAQAPQAVQRTAPFAFLVYDLVLLWFAEHAHATTHPVWPLRPWYRSKTTPSFPDMLDALRRAGWQTAFSQPPCPPRRLEKSPVAASECDLTAA